jgi:putative heme-binding domain-containing protein
MNFRMTLLCLDQHTPAPRVRVFRLLGVVALLIGCGFAFAADKSEPDETLAGAELLVELLGQTDDPAVQRDLLTGMQEALRGRKNLAPPRGWSAVYKKLLDSTDGDVRERATLLALLFGDPQATARLKLVAGNAKLQAAERRQAIQAMVDQRVAKLAAFLQQHLDDPVLRSVCIRGLAAYDDPQTPKLLLSRYAKLPDAEKQDVIATLAARVDYARSLLERIEQKQIPARDLSAFVVRQLQSLGDQGVNEQVDKLWGTVRPTSAEKQAVMQKYKSQLTPEILSKLKPTDLSQGRLLFSRTCQQCHKLFDVGGDVGPNLTGSNRANVDYILENVLDPSAVIGRDFQLNTLVTVDGRVLSGIIRERNEKTLVIQTANEKVVVSNEDIEELKPSTASMMPEGVFEKLTTDEVRNLVGYLRNPEQVPLPEGASQTVPETSK